MQRLSKIAKHSVTLLMICAVGWSCSSSNFSGSSKIARPKPPQDQNVIGQTTGGGGSTGTTGTTPERSTSVINGQACVNEIPTVDVAMVIDRSGSMDPQLHAVRDGLGSFSSALRSQVLPGFNLPIKNLRFTLVAFEDEEDRPNCPWFVGGPYGANDPGLASALQSEFTRANRGGSDSQEGGIAAIRKAMEIMTSQPEDSVKVVVLVTDNYMHDGTGTQGNRYGGFSTLDAVFSSPKAKPFMLFSSSSTSNGAGGWEDDTQILYDRSGHGTAQIAALRNYYKQVAGLPNAYVGEEFTPVNRFNSSSLSSLVAAKIAAGIKKCP